VPATHAALLTLALVLLYEGAAFLFLGMLGRPRTGLLLSGPVSVLLPLAGILRGARVPLHDALRLRAVPPASIALAVVGLIAAVPPVLAVAVRFVRPAERVEQFFTELLRAGSAADLAVVFLVAALVPAVTEEVLFRGFLQGALERRLGRWPGILLAAAAFGAIHGLTRAPTAAVLGIVLGWIASRAGSVVPAIAAHAAVNAVAVSIVNTNGFGTGDGWPETLPLPALLMWAAISAGALAAFARGTATTRAGPAA
jgi:membrane protease YdiL (CAAX protease family)